MPNSIVSSLFGSQQFTIKNTNTGVQTAQNIKVMSVDIKYTSTPLRHTREDGVTFIDTRVIRPTSCEVVFMCPDVDTFTQVVALLSDRQNTYSVVARGVTMNEMMVDTEALRQVPEVLSATPMQINFKQLLVQNVQPLICMQASDSSLIDRGMAALSTASLNVQGLYNNVSSFVAKAL